MAYSASDHEHMLGRLMGMAGRAMRRLMEANLERAGYEMTFEHMITLRVILEHEGINQQALAEHICRDKTAATRWIDFLQKRNLVTRVPDKGDRRQNMVFLTKQGKAAVKALHRIALETQKTALEGIDSNNVRICKEVLIQVHRNLTENRPDEQKVK